MWRHDSELSSIRTPVMGAGRMVAVSEVIQACWREQLGGDPPACRASRLPAPYRRAMRSTGAGAAQGIGGIGGMRARAIGEMPL